MELHSCCSALTEILKTTNLYKKLVIRMKNDLLHHLITGKKFLDKKCLMLTACSTIFTCTCPRGCKMLTLLLTYCMSHNGFKWPEIPEQCPKSRQMLIMQL